MGISKKKESEAKRWIFSFATGAKTKKTNESEWCQERDVEVEWVFFCSRQISSPDLRHGSPYLELCSRLPAKRATEGSETAGSPLG